MHCVEKNNSSAVKTNTSKKRKKSMDKSAEDKLIVLSNEEKDLKSNSCEIDLEKKVAKKRRLHFVLPGQGSEETTDTEDSESERITHVIHGKTKKESCQDCMARKDPNERCYYHKWRCICSLKCSSRRHLRNHLRAHVFQEVSKEMATYFSVGESYDLNNKPNDWSKQVRFSVEIVVPFTKSEFLYFLKTIGIWDPELSLIFARDESEVKNRFNLS